MSSLPYMQLYVSDYLVDTAHLTAQQHGAYMLLLMNYWQKGRALDNTNDRLQYVARLSPEEWDENKEILAEFFVLEGDTWWHSRIETDLEKVREKSTKASANGKRSVSARLANAEQTPNHKDKDKDVDKETTSSFELFWDSYPRKVGKREAEKAYQRALGDASAADILEGAIRLANDPNRIPTFTPHPATWLNQGRWTDEPLPPRTPEVAPKGLITAPTYQPPRYDPNEALERASRAIPMPEEIRSVLRK